MARVHTQKEEMLRDASAALERGEIVIVVLPGGRRDIVDRFFPGGVQTSLLGRFCTYDGFTSFTDARKAQEFLFETP